MPLDPEARAYLDRMAAAGAVPNHELPVAEARRQTELAAPELFGPVEPVGAVVDRILPGPGGPLRVRVYDPADGARPLPVLVYCHGGGWVTGSPDTHDGVCRALATATPCIVVSVDYRLAPEHPFPAAVDDAWAATAWTWEHAATLGADRERLGVGGDSAGGTLAAVVARRARDRGLRLSLQLLVYPVTDLDFETGSYVECGEGFGLSREAMRWYWRQYLGPDGHASGSDPETCPLRADDLGGLAPAHVITVEFDPLRDEGEAYARRLVQAGVAVTHTRYDGLIHGCYRMPAVMERAQEALEESARMLAAAFSRGARTPAA